MDIQGYRGRVCDQELQEQLEASGAVLIEGAKWCGKTWTSSKYAKSSAFLDNDTQKTINVVVPSLQEIASLIIRGDCLVI